MYKIKNKNAINSAVKTKFNFSLDFVFIINYNISLGEKLTGEEFRGGFKQNSNVKI